MWHTSAGDRVLQGAEAHLLKAALTAIVEEIKEEASSDGDLEQWEYGIPRFDELTWTQRLQLLEHVASNLLLPSAGTPDLNAVNESAVAALYERMRHEIDFEIDSETGTSTQWRQMVLAAYDEQFGEEEEDFEDDEVFVQPEVTSADRKAWSFLIECLEDHILWDQDFLMDEFLDSPPEKSQRLKQFMGIDDDYYSSIAPDVVTDGQTAELFKRIETLGG
jgi:hypothetical protein